MQIQVSGKHIDIGDALRAHVTERLEALVGKYFDRPVDGQVTFSRDGHQFRADCSVHLNSGMRLNSHGEAGDIYASFDTSVERLDKRLRRYKRRVKDHHSRRSAQGALQNAAAYVLAAEQENAEEQEDLQPVIIAEGTTQIPELTVGEAVMQMDISDVPFVMFRNQVNETLNIVYRRDDGKVGWIDPGNDIGRA